MSKNATEFMADLFHVWLTGEPEIPLYEFLHLTREECDLWLTKKLSCEAAQDFYLSRTGRA